MDLASIVTLIWAVVIALGVIMYIILDGFDIGVGILFPFISKNSHRDIMVNSIAPFWDGNETWLVLGGAGLFAAFPKAYAIILPALYIPITLFLIGIIFRGVSFEFRFKAHEKLLWDISFVIGSTLMAFSQGLILGSLIQGVKIEGLTYVGGPFDWFTPFTIVTGFGMIAGYALLGATWLIIKTEGELQQIVRQISYPLLTLMLFLISIVSIWTPIISEEIFKTWFSFPNIIFLSPVPVITIYISYKTYEAIYKKYEYKPFIYSISLFILSYVGLAISNWPYIIPRSLTIWKAAASFDTQLFSLVGVLFLLPFVLGYTYNTYKIFKGKVTEEDKLY